MADGIITFSCPACDIKLEIPSDMAGVTGPCPACNTWIQAPHQAPVTAPVSPLPPAPSPPRTSRPAADDDPIRPPVPVAPPPPSQAEKPIQVPRPLPTTVRPEPRQSPEPRQVSANSPESVAKTLPEPKLTGIAADASPALHTDLHKRSRFARIHWLFVFAIVTVVLIAGGAKLLKNQSQKPTAKLTPAEKPVPIMVPMESVVSETSDVPERRLVPEPSSIKPSPPPGTKLKTKSPSEAAREVLDRFLAAKTLAERLPLIETRTQEEELAKSCLAAPLAAVTDISIESTETDPVKHTVGFYHSIEFDAGNNRTRPHTILVRMRGSAEPKIVVDPFLDSYGGRLAAYAQAPSDKIGVFQVIIWPLAACFDERVPGREKKLTLKLLPQDNVKEIALAYFDKQSKIGRMLEDDSLGYGKAKACTVMLRWNVEERPETPYLEAVDFKTLDWNP